MTDGPPLEAKVHWRKTRLRERLWNLGWTLYGLGTIVVGGVMWADATLHLGRPMPPWISIPVTLFGLGLYGWPALLAAGLFAGRKRDLGTARVTRSPEGGVAIESAKGSLRVSREALAQGAVVGRSLLVDDAEGRSISIDTPEAAKLLDALDLEAERRRFRFRWRNLSPRIWSFLGALFSTSCLASAPLVLTAHSSSPSLAFIGCMLVSSPWLVAELVSRWYAVRELTVGLDGVAGKSRRGATMIRFADVASVRTTQAELVFAMKDGREEKLFCDPEEPGLRRAIEDRIREALAIARKNAGTGSAAAALLERGGRSLPEWREAAARVLTAASGFREAVVSAEELSAVIDDATATAEQRIAAAIALGGREDPAVRAKIRVAAEASASPKLRVALEGLADGSATDEVLEEAMREERKAGGRS